ncbi:MAG: hypothetical protein EOO11_21415 [Chitinophagaceae bacterium]|nr:MAG: hypothetical protein EOO11_21415 [Chitinophagaceae bacterium]
MNPDDQKPEEKKGPFGPDPETLHSTDPQEHMRGPFSGRVNDVNHALRKPGNAEPQFRDERERDGGDPWTE